MEAKILSKLSIKEIIDLSFMNTTALIDSYIKEESQSIYTEYASAGVKRRVDHLIENFNKDKKEFLELCNQIDDIPLKMLSFKKTESLLVIWNSIINKKDWWSSSVRKRLYGLRGSMSSEKDEFLKLSENL